MTRELKLALIVGFAMVLTVAILVSDHFSKARQATLADVAGMNANRLAAKPPEEPLKGTDDLLPATLPAAMSVSDTGGTHAPTDGGILPPSNPTANPTETNASLAQGASTPTEQPQTGVPLVIGQGSSGLPSTMFTQVQGDATIARKDMTSGAPSNTNPMDTAIKHSPAGDSIAQKVAEKKQETKPETKPEAKQALPIGPNDKVHVVAANDSLYAISKRYYGNGNLWRQLAAANAGRVSEDGSARVGTKIVIPSKDVLVGKAPAEKVTKPVPADTRADTRVATKPVEKKTDKPVAKPTEAAKPRSYTVKPGDSLGRIAARELGSSKRLGEVASLNGMDPDDDLIAGATIKLPAK